MFAGQVKLASPSDAANQRIVRDNSANRGDTQAAFALVYEAVLELSEEQCAGTKAFDNWIDTDANGGLPATNYASSSVTSLIGDGSGTRDIHSAGKDFALEFGSIGMRHPGSSMGRFMPHGNETRIVPVPSHGPTVASLNRDGVSGQPVGPEGNVAASSSSGGVLNKSQLTDWMDSHALTRSSHHCAMYVRQGMEAAGLNTDDRPQSGDAGDYGSFLLRHGAQTVSSDSYAPQVGDVVVFDKTVQHPNGHIEMYDGHQWVSDFRQNSFSPYRDIISTPPFTIYRLG